MAAFGRQQPEAQPMDVHARTRAVNVITVYLCLYSLAIWPQDVVLRRPWLGTARGKQRDGADVFSGQVPQQ